VSTPTLALPAADAVRGARASAALAGLLLSAALVPLGSTTVAVALPAVGAELGTEPALLTDGLVGSYLLVNLVLQSPGGSFADRWGVRQALSLGQALFAAGAVLGLVAASLPLLVVARVLMASGGALLVPAAMAALRHATAPARRARVFGAFGAAMGLAAALGPLVGGLLVEALGWRSIFLLNLPILAAAAPLLRGLPATEIRRGSTRFDWAGSVLLCLGLTLAVTGSRAGGGAAAALLAGGGAALLLFVLWERRAADPVLDPELLRNRAFAAGAVLIALHNGVMYGLLFLLPHWMAALGSGSSGTGTLMIALLLSMVIGSPLGGRAVERLGYRTVAVAGALAVAAGLYGMTAAAAGGRASLSLTGALVLVGAGLGLAAAPAQSAAVGAVPAGRSGMAAGALSTLRYLGGLLGVAALGALLRASGTEPTAALEVYPLGVRFAVGVALVGVAVAALLPATHGDAELQKLSQ
jgi:MFS family permease